jgi:hypothetical protein
VKSCVSNDFKNNILHHGDSYKLRTLPVLLVKYNLSQLLHLTEFKQYFNIRYT